MDVIMSPAAKKVDMDDYVNQLVKYVKDVHNKVLEHRDLVTKHRQDAIYRKYGTGQYLNVGEYCFVKRPPERDVSTRFQLPHYDEIFQVVERHGDGAEAKAYTLCDVTGKTEGLGFVQPVATERLVPVNVLPSDSPVEEKTELAMLNGTDERRATVKSVCVDGRVNIQYEDEEQEECVDLTQCNYRWL